MIGVIDTSALIRLFIPDGPIPEGFEKFLSGVERGANTAISPELLLVESANVLKRKRINDEISKSESTQLLTDILSMPIRYFPHGPIISAAFDLSLEHELTVYDAVFLALASQKGAILFTADSALQEAADKMHLR